MNKLKLNPSLKFSSSLLPYSFICHVQLTVKFRSEMKFMLLFWCQFFDYFEYVITTFSVSLFCFHGSAVSMHVKWYRSETWEIWVLFLAVTYITCELSINVLTFSQFLHSKLRGRGQCTSFKCISNVSVHFFFLLERGP